MLLLTTNTQSVTLGALAEVEGGRLGVHTTAAGCSPHSYQAGVWMP
jgi:hypothetical protein